MMLGGNAWKRLVLTDEMNVSVPQEIGLIEAMTVGSAVYYAVSPQNGAPCMGCVQNTLTMAGVCTTVFDTPRNAGDESTCLLPDGSPGYEILISRDTAHDAYTQAKIPPKVISEYLKRVQKVYPQYVEKTKHGLRFAEYITGRVLYSIVFPQNLRWKRNTKTSKIYPMVHIHDGILMPDSGPLCKSCIGGTSGSIIHLMWRSHPIHNRDFINQLVMISGILTYRVGFSFSFGDCQTDPSIGKKIEEALEEAERSVKKILEKGLDPEEEEKEVNKSYNKVREVSDAIAKNMNKGMHNSLSILTGYGIKGNPLNVTQTAGITGQQNVSGGRIPWGCTNLTRLTSHFPRNDKSAEAKGLVKNSFIGGLSYQETFMAAMAGREAVVATGTKTADSGYTQKKLSKKLGDTKAYQDGTLRNAQGQIISPFYGGDGLNPKMKIFSHSPEIGKVKGDRIFFFTKLDHIIGELESDFERLQSSEGSAEGLVDRRENEPEGKNRGRAKRVSTNQSHKKRLITFSEANAIISKIQAGAPGYQSPVTKQATENEKSHLVKFLTTVSTYEEILPDLAVKISDDFERAKVYHGFPAGLVACLSIGEISTQLTLNTFHVAGLGEKEANSGISRFNELVGVSKEPKKPTMTIYIAPEAVPKTQSKEEALRKYMDFSMMFKYQVLENFMEGSPKLLRVGSYDPERESPLSFEGLYSEFEEPEWMTFYCETYEIEIPIEPTDWVIQLNLNKRNLYTSGLTPWDIALILEKYHLAGPQPSLRCVPSPSLEAKVLIFLDSNDAGNYARSLMTYPEGMSFQEMLITENNIPFFAAREVAKSLTTIPIQGIQGITKAFPRLEGDSWVVGTAGSNFSEVLSDPMVDPTRTMSDNLREVEMTLGIEAAREFLETELRNVIKQDGASVDDSHFAVVADAMSFSGELTPSSRYGISRDVGPISKLMFEKPIAEATISVVHNEVDYIRTIDAAVYMGQAPKLGTGSVKVISGEISRSSIPAPKVPGRSAR